MTLFNGNYFGALFYTPGYFAASDAFVAPCASPTLADAQAALASRLNDPTFIRWTSTECTTYIREAIRTWSAWTQYWRARGVSTALTMNAPFLDLPTAFPFYRAMTVSTWEIVQDLQYALLEPPAPGGTWTGTQQFTLEQLTRAIERRRDQFLRETGAVVTRTVTYFPAVPSSGWIPLPACTLHVRRAAWRVQSSQTILPLARTDTWAADHFAPRWPQSAVADASPKGYATSATPPLTLQVIPPPAAAGTLDLISIDAGDTIDPSVNAILGVPDDLAWVVKYGALADLLSGDGLALDPQRQAYCEQRWAQGIQIARTQPVVLSARINNAIIPTAAITDADSYAPTWQMVAGVPRRLLLVGQNLVGIWPPPNAAGPYLLLVDLVRNAPMPSLPTDPIDVPDDVYDSILDLAQHAALFKEGPGQVELALSLLERAARNAGVDLQLQQAEQPSRRPIIGQQAQNAAVKPRELPMVPVE